jgi:hypothetical protein
MKARINLYRAYARYKFIPHNNVYLDLKSILVFLGDLNLIINH